MSKNIAPKTDREFIFEKLKNIYIHNFGIYFIDSVLQAEGLEQYNIDDLNEIYNNLGKEHSSTIAKIYKQPQLALQDKDSRSLELDQCFLVIAKIYIKEYLALELLLRTEIHRDELSKIMQENMLFADIVNLNQISKSFTMHVKEEDLEEKHAEAQDPLGFNLEYDPVIELIRSHRLVELYNPIEILHLISEEFPNSITYLHIKDMEAAGVSVAEIFQNLVPE